MSIKNKKETILQIFDKTRNNDYINADEFIVKIDGPLNPKLSFL